MNKPKKIKRKGRPRLEHEKKQSCKGRKSMRGQPEAYDELKKIVSLSLTPTALAGLDESSARLNISRSELVERIGRGLLTIAELTTKTE
ncbi:hypothetical protein [Coleofasciculus sp. FACHB-SPT9]|uniref:hypothetical protein n=1 Tax=Cyanophyceae TaxID=3028117 RepID=UPI001F554D2B|nr:hypothetical protein [Coleofasciculus sp. FACHB-SPT9]